MKDRVSEVFIFLCVLVLIYSRNNILCINIILCFIIVVVVVVVVVAVSSL